MQSVLRPLAPAALGAAMILALGAGGVAAHTQTVSPSGTVEGFTKGVSQPWAQAHCHAASPGVLATTAEHAANSWARDRQDGRRRLDPTAGDQGHLQRSRNRTATTKTRRRPEPDRCLVSPGSAARCTTR